MPLPAIPFVSVLAGGFVAGLVNFFVSRIGSVLVGLGLTMLFSWGAGQLINMIVGDIQNIISMARSGGGGASFDVTGLAIGVAGHAGLFDAINIILSGYAAGFSVAGMRVIFGRTPNSSVPRDSMGVPLGR